MKEVFILFGVILGTIFGTTLAVIIGIHFIEGHVVPTEIYKILIADSVAIAITGFFGEKLYGG